MLTNVRDTSIESYQSLIATGRFGAQECKIMALIRDNQHIDFTRREIAKILEMETSTVAARVNQLVKDGELVERENKRFCTVSGVNVYQVGLPLDQAYL